MCSLSAFNVFYIDFFSVECVLYRIFSLISSAFLIVQQAVSRPGKTGTCQGVGGAWWVGGTAWGGPPASQDFGATRIANKTSRVHTRSDRGGGRGARGRQLSPRCGL
jgi:hypothetical protein